MTAAYEEDLAFVHDAGFGDFARNAAPGLLAILRAKGIDSGRVVDLGCGSGIWAAELVRAGYDVTGVDISAAMIDLAQERAPQAKLHVASFLDVPLPQCRAVTALGEVLNYRFDERHSRAALQRLFRRIFAALEPCGMLICDLAEPGRHRNISQRFFEGSDWATLVEFDRDESRDTLTRRIVTFRRIGDHWRQSEESHPLQLYRSAEIARMLRTAGFRVRIVRAYGNAPLAPDTAGYIARRP